MSTALHPETPSGAYRIRRARARPAAAPGSPGPAATRCRLDHVDLLRGLVMVVMVLDHVRANLTDARFDPTDLARTDLALFGTRWITHFCAPTFVFLAGASAWIAGTRRTRGELARFLVTRGLWLIFLELTLITFGWYFTTRMTIGMVAQVIWVIGASMVVLAGLTHLPREAVAAVGLALVLGHNLLDGITPEQLGAFAPLWRVLHVPGPLEVVPVFLLYPLVPWAGVMALGYAAGPAVFSEDPGSSRRLAWVGGMLVLAFVVLRSLDLYGDPSSRLDDGTPVLMAMSFLNLTKYPPSLLFLLMTLGPVIALLPVLENARGRFAEWLQVFGREPLFFYLLHIPFIHAVAVAISLVRTPEATSWLFLNHPLRIPPAPEGYRYPLPMLWAVWIAVSVALYYPTRWYGRLKERTGGRGLLKYI